MITAPLLRMILWIAIAIAISTATFHLLAPDSPTCMKAHEHAGPTDHSPAWCANSPVR